MQRDNEEASLPELRSGTALITPLDERAEPLHGSLLSLDVGDNGLSVVAKAHVPPTAQVGTQRVWVMAKQGGRVTSFQGLAQQPEPSVIEVTGLTAPVDEYRRAYPRAAVDLHCHMRPSGGVSMAPWTTGRVLDLSRRSCRIHVPDDTRPAIAAQTELVIDLDGTPFPVFAVVTRTDPASVAVVFSFMSLSRKEAAQLDRFVLGRLAAA